jgi:hypothetical protein
MLKINKITLINPYLQSILLLFIGLIGFVTMQIILDNLNFFSIIFTLLSFVLLLFFLKWALLLELKRKWVVKPINPFIGYVIITFKLFLLFILLKVGGSSTFDGRLEMFNSSFLFGVEMGLSLMVFPLLPLFSSSVIVRKLAIYVFIASSTVALLMNPSKSIFIFIFFNILLYKFLYNKIHGLKSNIKFLSVKALFIFTIIAILTLFLMFTRYGFDGFEVIIHRIAYNFDIAIYASMIPFDKTPEYSNLFYSIFPLLKQIDPLWNLIEFNKIPEWVLNEALNINTKGRYGYPNDNFIVGLLVSYKYFGIFIFGIFIFIIDAYVKYTLSKDKISAYSLYILLVIPLFFLSTQDFSIKLLVVSFVVAPLTFLFAMMPKIKHVY